MPTGLRQKPDFKQPTHVLVRWMTAGIHHCPRANPDAGRTVARGGDSDLNGRTGGVQQPHGNGLPRHCSVVPADVLPINGETTPTDFSSVAFRFLSTGFIVRG